MDVLHRYAEELGKHPLRIIARLMLRMLAVKPPRMPTADAKSLATPQRYGPFRPGTVVRVAVACNAWYAFGGASVWAVDPSIAPGLPGEPAQNSGNEMVNGTPLAAWTFVDHLVSNEAEAFVSIVRDQNAVAPLYGHAYDTGSILSDEP
jgi:hypothetical protein